MKRKAVCIIWITLTVLASMVIAWYVTGALAEMHAPKPFAILVTIFIVVSFAKFMVKELLTFLESADRIE